MENIEDIIWALCNVRPLSIDALIHAFDDEEPENIKRITSEMITKGSLVLTVKWKLEARKVE